MKNFTIICILFGILNCYAQDVTKSADSIKIKTNPIVFAEIFAGYSNGATRGWTAGGSINYQIKNNLFTFRGLGFAQRRYDGNILFFPIYTTTDKIEEYALMYGRRSIDDDSSFSYSAGIAIVNYTSLDEVNSTQNNLKYISQNLIGFPIECNIKWFKSKKERYRIYHLIPVGKPTALGRSIGLKAFANISQQPFVGIALNYGIGYHKNY